MQSFYAAENMSQADSVPELNSKELKNSVDLTTFSRTYYGVGFKVNLDEIETCIGGDTAFSQIGSYDQIYGALYENGPSVLIVSMSEPMVLEKFRVCCLVWDLKLYASYKIQPIHGGEKLINECRQRNIKYMIILKPGLYQSDRLKIRCVKKNKEEELTMSGLWNFLRLESRHKPRKENLDDKINT